MPAARTALVRVGRQGIQHEEPDMSTKRNRIAMVGTALCLLLTAGGAAGQQAFNVTPTADNAYAFYIGDGTSATSFEGWQPITGSIWAVESYDRVAPDTSWVYIAAWSDHGSFQGLLVDFMNQTNGGRVLGGDTIWWEVTATGDMHEEDDPPSLDWMTEKILEANAGMNPSGGWVTPAVSPLTNAEGGIHNVSVVDIEDDSRWMWYDCGRQTDPGEPNPPFQGGFNHDEYLIFRIPVTAPEPASLSLLALGGVVLLVRRRMA
jgi:hypothetical protein